MILFPPVISDYDDVFTNETNVTNVTINETNVTINETNVTINETNVTINETNLTINETNEVNVTNSSVEKTKRRRSNNDDDDDEERQREQQRMLDDANETKNRKLATLQDYINNNTNPNDIPSHLLTGNIYDDYCWDRKQAKNPTYVYPDSKNYCNEDGLFCPFINGKYVHDYCNAEDFNKINN